MYGTYIYIIVHILCHLSFHNIARYNCSSLIDNGTNCHYNALSMGYQCNVKHHYHVHYLIIMMWYLGHCMITFVVYGTSIFCDIS